ncbi:MAG: hypothetical protein ACTS3F_08940 [Phycisphaerales bacterium]
MTQSDLSRYLAAIPVLHDEVVREGVPVLLDRMAFDDGPPQIDPEEWNISSDDAQEVVDTASYWLVLHAGEVWQESCPMMASERLTAWKMFIGTYLNGEMRTHASAALAFMECLRVRDQQGNAVIERPEYARYMQAVDAVYPAFSLRYFRERLAKLERVAEERGARMERIAKRGPKRGAHQDPAGA